MLHFIVTLDGLHLISTCSSYIDDIVCLVRAVLEQP